MPDNRERVRMHAISEIFGVLAETALPGCVFRNRWVFEVSDRLSDKLCRGELERSIRFLRPEVLAFAHAMEVQLLANEHKAGWKNDKAIELVDRIVDEVEELAAEVCCGQADPARILKESADVANFAMMVADVSGCIEKAGEADRVEAGNGGEAGARIRPLVARAATKSSDASPALPDAIREAREFLDGEIIHHGFIEGGLVRRCIAEERAAEDVERERLRGWAARLLVALIGVDSFKDHRAGVCDLICEAKAAGIEILEEPR